MVIAGAGIALAHSSSLAPHLSINEDLGVGIATFLRKGDWTVEVEKNL